MTGRRSAFLIAALLLVLAVPSIAQASKATFPAGTLGAVGTPVQFTNQNAVTLKSTTLGPLSCEGFRPSGKVTKNDGSQFAVQTQGSVSPFLCQNDGQPLTVGGASILLSSSSSGKGASELTLNYYIEEFHCTFTGTGVPFTYTPGSNTVAFAAAGTFVGSPKACGTGTLTAKWSLESGSTPAAVILD